MGHSLHGVSVLLLLTGSSRLSGSSSVETGLSVLVLVSLHVHDELLDQSEDLGSVDHVQAEGTLRLGLLVVLVVSLVSDVLLLDLSKLLNLVVINEELLSVESSLVELLLGISSVVWVLEANEGIDGFVILGVELDIFNGTELSEEFLELIFGGVGREVLDVEVASLL